jgi:Mn2+/Fe2+ NRAMP family transporter
MWCLLFLEWKKSADIVRTTSLETTTTTTTTMKINGGNLIKFMLKDRCQLVRSDFLLRIFFLFFSIVIMIMGEKAGEMHTLVVCVCVCVSLVHRFLCVSLLLLVSHTCTHALPLEAKRKSKSKRERETKEIRNAVSPYSTSKVINLRRTILIEMHEWINRQRKHNN